MRLLRIGNKALTAMERLKQLITLPLLPVVYFQGKKLKRNTPKLKEPEGKRRGIDGEGPVLSLLIIGDSAAAGVGVCNQQHSLLGRLVNNLKPHYQVHWYLHAKSGVTTTQTLRSLDKIEKNQFDIIITSIGLNDLTQGIKRQHWLKTMSLFNKAMLERFKPKLIITSGLPPIGKFPRIPIPLNWYLGRKSENYNIGLQQMFASDPQIDYLALSLDTDLHQQIPNDYLASDGFHPSAKVYQLWADQASNMITCYLNKTL